MLGQVDAVAHGVFAHVADDVGKLQGTPEHVGVGGGLLLRLPENACRNFAHNACNQVAVLLQAVYIGVACLVQIAVAAFNNCHEVLLRDAKCASQWHKRLHDGVAGLACVALLDFVRPPCQFGSGYARFADLIDYVIYLAAKGVKSCNGSAALGWQKQKSIVKAAACGGGFLLHICLW